MADNKENIKGADVVAPALEKVVDAAASAEVTPAKPKGKPENKKPENKKPENRQEGKKSETEKPEPVASVVEEVAPAVEVIPEAEVIVKESVAVSEEVKEEVQTPTVIEITNRPLIVEGYAHVDRSFRKKLINK